MKVYTCCCKIFKGLTFFLDTMQCSLFIIMQNVVATSHAVCAHVRGSKNFSDAGARSPNLMGVADPLEARPTCYETEFGRSTPSRIGIGKGFQKVGGTLGSGTSLWQRC